MFRLTGRVKIGGNKDASMITSASPLLFIREIIIVFQFFVMRLVSRMYIYCFACSDQSDYCVTSVDSFLGRGLYVVLVDNTLLCVITGDNMDIQ